MLPSGMTKLRSPILIPLNLALLGIGCAGPTSPFGSLEIFSGDGRRMESLSAADAKTEFSLSPAKQNLHMPYPLELSISNLPKSDSDRSIRLFYNQKEITHTWHKKSRLVRLGDSGESLRFDNLILDPQKSHQIEFLVEINSQAGKPPQFVKIKHPRPTCDIDDKQKIKAVNPFQVPPQTIAMIEKLSRSFHLNPAMMGGLIAQESSFEASAVSSAKAIGLTQITPIAHLEIQKFRPDWKADQRAFSHSQLNIQRLIENGQLTAKTDWRLHPIKSIEGGALYLKYLEQYWESADNKDLRKSMSANEFSDVLLASYNSGAARVKRALLTSRREWLKQEELKEAFKYVQRVSSYCYHFANPN